MPRQDNKTTPVFSLKPPHGLLMPALPAVTVPGTGTAVTGDAGVVVVVVVGVMLVTQFFGRVWRMSRQHAQTSTGGNRGAVIQAKAHTQSLVSVRAFP